MAAEQASEDCANHAVDWLERTTKAEGALLKLRKTLEYTLECNRRTDGDEVDALKARAIYASAYALLRQLEQAGY